MGAVAKKTEHLIHEGKSPKQAYAIANSMQRAGRLTREGGYVRAKNPGSIANKGGSRPHGGFEMKRSAKKSGDGNMVGAPPMEGFHKVSSGVGPQGAAVKRQALNPHKHLGRFSTGKPRKGVSKHTSVPSIAN